ncbi:MAG: hypothetical protein SGPRY_001582 [Prymnesium sp.]
MARPLGGEEPLPSAGPLLARASGKRSRDDGAKSARAKRWTPESEGVDKKMCGRLRLLFQCAATKVILVVLMLCRVISGAGSGSAVTSPAWKTLPDSAIATPVWPTADFDLLLASPGEPRFRGCVEDGRCAFDLGQGAARVSCLPVVRGSALEDLLEAWDDEAHLCELVSSETDGPQLNAFNVESHSSCEYDALTVNAIQYCGAIGPAGVVVTDGNVTWLSNDVITASGWEICWFPAPPPSPFWPPSSPPAPPSPPTPPPSLPRFAESFETPPPWSGWATGITGYAWSQNSGSTLSLGTGPSVAFAGSYYMYIEATGPRVEGDVFDLSYTCSGSTGVAAVEFWYHMYGSGIGTLRLRSGLGEVNWEKSGEQRDSWQHAHVYSSSFSPVVVFEGVRGSYWSGDIAVDDVAVTSLIVPEGTHLMLGGSELELDNVNLSIASSGSGAVIDGQGLSRLFHLKNGAALWLSQIRLQGGGGVALGGALYLESFSMCTLTRSSISDIEIVGAGFDIWGGAIFANSSDCILMNSSITGVNLSQGLVVRGGAVFATAGGSVHLTDVNIFSFHISAGHRVLGGALHLLDSSIASMRSVTISSFNMSAGEEVEGGALCLLTSCSASMSKVTISSFNMSSGDRVNGGTMRLLESSTASMSCMTIFSFRVSASSAVEGGALAVQISSTVSISEANITSFYVIAGELKLCGALYLFNSSAASMSAVTISSFDVSAGETVEGGALCLKSSSTISMSEVTISTFKVSSGVLLRGALYLLDSSTASMSKMTIASFNMSAGESVEGGALSLLTSCTVSMSEVTISTFNVNAGEDSFGGALYLWVSSTANLSDVTISTFQVIARDDVEGGALHLVDSSTAIMISMTISSFHVSVGQFAWGGAIYLFDFSTAIMSEVVISFFHVTASEGFEGGALQVLSSSTASMSSMTISSFNVNAYLVWGSMLLLSDSSSANMNEASISSFNVSAGNNVRGGALQISGSSTANIREVTIFSCIVSAGDYVEGGAVHLRSSSTANLTNVIISSFQVSSRNGIDGGALHLYASSTASMSSMTIFSFNVSAGSNVEGGAMYMSSSNASMTSMTIAFFSVRAGNDVYGGALDLQISSTVSMDEVAIFSLHVIAGELVRGGIISLAVSSSMEMSNGSVLYAGTVNATQRRGDVLWMAGTVFTYTFPVPPGSWLPATECKVVRDPPSCPSVEPAKSVCDSFREQLLEGCSSILDEQASVSFPVPCRQTCDGWWGRPVVACPTISRLQACPWWERPELIGQNVYVVPPGSIDEDFPFQCQPGVRGSDNVSQQLSPLCGGLCPAGQGDAYPWHLTPRGPAGLLDADPWLLIVCAVFTVCDSRATTDPQPCEAGSFCPAGSVVMQPCPAGTYSNATGLADKSQCSPCPSGSACSTGSTSPSACPPGTVQPLAGQEECEACEGGTFRSESNGTSCESCRRGSYCPRGSSVPLPCLEGSFSGATNLTSAEECTQTGPGYFSPTGSVEQRPCSAGTFSDSYGAAECSQCDGGTYQDEEGATECNACGRGTYCQRGAASQLPCDAGTYSNATGLSNKSQCSPCPAGSACSTGSTAPILCAPGTSQPQPEQTLCEQCKAGTYQDKEGAIGCKDCRDGSYCPAGAPNPLGCESGAGIPFAVTNKRRAIGPAACVCEAGHFNNTLRNWSCVVCPSGTDCRSAGFTLATLPVRPGYFRRNPESVDVRRCPDAASNCSNDVQCETSTSGCAGSATSTGCHAGLEGAYCLLCTHDSDERVYYSAATSTARAQCKECPDALLHLILIVLGSVLAACVGGWLLYHGYRRLPAASKLQLQESWHKFTLHVKLKIVVGFYLIAGVIDDVYEVEMPPEAKQLLSFFYVCVSFGFTGIDQLLECLNLYGYVARLTAYMLTPPLIAIIIVLLSAGYMRLQGTLSGAATLAQFASPYLLLLLFLTYPIVSRMAFSGFSCYEFTSSAWLKADVAIECYTSSHRAVQALASAAIVLYPLSLLILTGALLLKARISIIAERPTPLSTAISFLHREYKPHMYWWELVEMLRRFVLVGLMVLYQDTMMQLILATLLSAMFLLLQVQASPYRKGEDDFLASVSSFCLLVIFLCATAFKYLMLTNLDDIQDKMSIEQRQVYVLSGDGLLVILIATSIVTLVCSVGIFIVQLAAARIKLLDEEELAILRGEALPNEQHSTYWSKSSALRVGSRILQLRRVVVHIKRQPSTRRPPNGRFTATNTMISGQLEEAAFGLTHVLGVHDPFGFLADGVEKICAEVTRFVQGVRALDEASHEMQSLIAFAQVDSGAHVIHEQINADVLDWLEYILKDPASEKQFSNGVRDAGREPVHFDFFLKHEMAQKAELDPAHVLALRLYTTHAFKYINGPLRATGYGRGKRPHPLPITVMFISEGIKRLRAVYAASKNATKVVNLWRGIKNLKVAEEFMMEQRGGTEVAPMSTTSNFRVAAQYGLSENTLIFKIKVSNFMQYGAELQWLSAFPGDAEVCYPPLTYLQPTGRTQVVTIGSKRFTVCEVVPHIP